MSSPCLACGTPGPPLCGSCADRLEPARAFVPPIGLATCTALLAYEGPARQLVAGLKYRNARRLVERVSVALAESLRQNGIDDHLELITWAPTSLARRRARGYDQAQLLAYGVGRQLDLPVIQTLQRLPGLPQTGLDRSARISSPRFRGLMGDIKTAILLVDDVVTTGATLSGAAAVLTRCGATAIHGAVLAQTPAHFPQHLTESAKLPKRCSSEAP